jgi:hypothetical protein
MAPKVPEILELYLRYWKQEQFFAIDVTFKIKRC